jgi:hypothetical protein
MTEWWIDYDPWPGPDIYSAATADEWLALADNIKALALFVGEPTKNFISKMAGVADAFSSAGESAGTYAPLTPPAHDAPPPGMTPRHVGPRPKRTFGRGGKRNF